MWLSRKIFDLSGIRRKYLKADFYERTLLDSRGHSMYLQTVPGGDAFCVLLHQIKFQPFQGVAYVCLHLWYLLMQLLFLSFLISGLFTSLYTPLG
jgi:hypothetical protein